MTKSEIRRQIRMTAFNKIQKLYKDYNPSRWTEDGSLREQRDGDVEWILLEMNSKLKELDSKFTLNNKLNRQIKNMHNLSHAMIRLVKSMDSSIAIAPYEEKCLVLLKHDEKNEEYVNLVKSKTPCIFLPLFEFAGIVLFPNRIFLMPVGYLTDYGHPDMVDIKDITQTWKKDIPEFIKKYRIPFEPRKHIKTVEYVNKEKQS